MVVNMVVAPLILEAVERFITIAPEVVLALLTFQLIVILPIVPGAVAENEFTIANGPNIVYVDEAERLLGNTIVFAVLSTSTILTVLCVPSTVALLRSVNVVSPL